MPKFSHTRILHYMASNYIQNILNVLLEYIEPLNIEWCISKYASYHSIREYQYNLAQGASGNMLAYYAYCYAGIFDGGQFTNLYCDIVDEIHDEVDDHCSKHIVIEIQWWCKVKH